MIGTAGTSAAAGATAAAVAMHAMTPTSPVREVIPMGVLFPSLAYPAVSPCKNDPGAPITAKFACLQQRLQQCEVNTGCSY
ncbi:hypothetical protein GCM10010388_44000 [Streptomyces mauvecolor]